MKQLLPFLLASLASAQTWRNVLENLPPQPAPTTTAEDVNRVGSALSDASPILLSGGQSNYELNRELVRRTAAYLMALEVMTRDPQMRMAMGRVYRELGDIQARSAGRFGSRMDAARNYRRAGYLFGNLAAMRAGAYGIDYSMVDRELAGLGSRLASLESSAAKPTSPQTPAQPFPLQAPQVKDVPAAQRNEYNELSERYTTAAATASTALENVEPLRRSLEHDGMTLNTELAAGVSRMQLYLQLAAASMEERNWAEARSNIERAEYQTGKVLKAVGR